MLTIENLCDFGTKIHPFPMIKYFNRFMALIGFLSIIYPLAGCADSESKYRDEYFIRVGDSVITVLDFNRAFEIVKAFYSHGAMQQPDAVKEARLRFVKQMTEEMILRERARDIGIKITDEAAAVELICDNVRLVQSSSSNIKITSPDDLVLAAALMRL